MYTVYILLTLHIRAYIAHTIYKSMYDIAPTTYMLHIPCIRAYIAQTVEYTHLDVADQLHELGIRNIWQILCMRAYIAHTMYCTHYRMHSIRTWMLPSSGSACDQEVMPKGG